MYAHESKLLTKEHTIVCIGAGDIFYSWMYYLREKGIDKNVIAVADNNVKKQGTLINLFDRDYKIISLAELKELYQKKKFIIVITSIFGQDIREQIAEEPLFHNVEILDAWYEMQERKEYRVSYIPNLFGKGCGDFGENLSISILAHNRAELTIRLLESIFRLLPEFQGEILLGDNCSDKNELRIVKDCITGHEKCRIIEFGVHYPIPIGKNKLNQECKKEWILQLDNDIFLTDNPLRKINNDICALGCSIWGLPYYDTRVNKVVNYGSNLGYRYNRNGGIRLGCRYDLLYEKVAKEWEPMICTYTSGGASLFRKKFFVNLGGYDENLYMFEDIELMYRINQEGYKIGNIGMQCLVHDHKELEGDLGKEYELVRYDKNKEYESRKYIKDKYGFDV